MGGMDNLKSISSAVQNGTSASIMLGGEPVTLEYPEARYIYGLYKQAVSDGKQDHFMQMLADPMNFDRMMKGMRSMVYKQPTGQRFEESSMVNENANTLDHILKRFPKEIKDFKAGNELDHDLYEALFDYYFLHGEMPYGVAKGRSGDPYEWITSKLDQDLGIGHPTEAVAHMMESKRDQYGFDISAEKEPLAFGDVRKIRKGKPEPDTSKYKSTKVKGKKYGGEKQVDEAKDDDDDWYGIKPKKPWEKEPEQKYKSIKVTGHYGKEYQGEPDDLEPTKTKAAKDVGAFKVAVAPEKEKRGKGRPSQLIKKSDDGGVRVQSDYSAWYRKTKRTHDGAKIVGSNIKAVAIVQKGNKNYIAGEWAGNSGNIVDKLSKTIPASELANYKSRKGRPKKIREFIENLRYVVEGVKTREEIRAKLNETK